MKRIFALLLCCCALLAGCGGDPASSAGGSGAAASPVSGPASAATQSASESAPAVQPLTGLPLEGALMRPAAVMIDNSVTAQVQWGIADADVVMEGLTEGKSTSLCLWYSSVDAMPKVGPVSEGKDLFWQFGIAQNAILAQKGMNLYAENLLNCYTYQPIDALYVGVNSFDYDSSLPYGTPDSHRWYTSGGALRNSMPVYGIADSGAAPALFRFGTAPAGNAGAAAVELLYSSDRSTILRYDAAAGQWLMFRSDGAAQTDANTGAQAAFANVVLLRCAAGVKDNKYTREYDLAGGSGWYLTGDGWQPITWQKGDVTQTLRLFAADGEELTVNPGRSYIGIYGAGGQRVTITGADGAALMQEIAEDGAAYPAADQAPAG